MRTLTAIFEDGVLKPTTPLDLPDRTAVCIVIEALEDDQQKAQKLVSLQALWRMSRPHSTHLTRDELHGRR